LTERCEIWDHVSSNSNPPYLRTTEPTSSRQPTAPSTTATSAGAPPRSPAPVSTEGRSGVGGSSDGQDEQSWIVLPPETGDQPSLSSGLSYAPWLNRSLGSLYHDSIIEYEKRNPPPPPPPCGSTGSLETVTRTDAVHLFRGIRANWGWCSKTAEIIPFRTANHTNRAERCKNAPALEPARFKSKEENGARRFGPDFIGLLDWKKIRSETSLKKSNPKRRNELLPFNELK